MEVLIDNYTARFKDALWYKPNGKTLDITIGGVGGIGSWLALLLSRMGHKLHIIDDDYVEMHNLGGQLYRNQGIGKSKVSEIRDICNEFSPGTEIIPYPTRVDAENAYSLTYPVTFTAFDNMLARRIMAHQWMLDIKAKRAIGRAKKGDINLFIDGRMEAETGIIYCVNTLGRFDRYMDEMFTDDEVPDNPCTFRATSHNPTIMAGYMVGILNNHIYNKVYGQEVREVPFKVEYELPTMTYTTIR